MTYPIVDPVLIHMGPLQVRWYGLMYVIGFIVAYLILIDLCRRKDLPLTKVDIEDLLTGCIIGLVLGARVGYCLIYNPMYYLSHPMKFFAVWEGGMSFHGGLIGLLLTGWAFSVWRKKPFLMLADLGAVVATPGLFFGRIGNFINGELFGRVTDVPWAMVFPGGGPLPRHPSQIYEAVFEGLILFMILYGLSRKTRSHGIIVSVFLISYGIVRFFLEKFREPDPQLGFVLGTYTMGQILSGLMLVAGIGLLSWRLKSQRT
jgi:phosphatidylglycerol---prolipoprotein diacylglyceryl transferase